MSEVIGGWVKMEGYLPKMRWNGKQWEETGELKYNGLRVVAKGKIIARMGNVFCLRVVELSLPKQYVELFSLSFGDVKKEFILTILPTATTFLPENEVVAYAV